MPPLHDSKDHLSASNEFFRSPLGFLACALFGRQARVLTPTVLYDWFLCPSGRTMSALYGGFARRAWCLCWIMVYSFPSPAMRIGRAQLKVGSGGLIHLTLLSRFCKQWFRFWFFLPRMAAKVHRLSWPMIFREFFSVMVNAPATREAPCRHPCFHAAADQPYRLSGNGIRADIGDCGEGETDHHCHPMRYRVAPLFARCSFRDHVEF
jgi:hypothetical protein